MIRFLAAIWDVNNASAGQSARLVRERFRSTHTAWETVIDQPGLLLIMLVGRGSRAAASKLSGGKGVLIGTVFESPTTQRPTPANGARTEFTDAETQLLLHSKGRRIIDDFWGSYVLFLVDTPARRIFVVRGPMSTLPCFETCYGDIKLLYSWVDDCVALRLIDFSINWPSVRAQAAMGDYVTHETGINEISATECGECLEFYESKVTRYEYWTPITLATGGQITNPAQAADALRESTQRSVDGWASCYPRVLHTLSGGLDSSIVLACLRRSPNSPQIVCVNSYSRRAAGDERDYARAMARFAGVDLVERERDPNVNLSRFLTCARTARPVLALSACDSYPANLKLAIEHRATAIFNGELGDNVFGATATHEPVMEYAWRHGLQPGLFKVALDSAMLKRESIWRALNLGVRGGWQAPPKPFWSSYLDSSRTVFDNDRTVSEEALRAYERELPRFIHPWMRNTAKVPPGKAYLIFAIYTVTSASFHPPFAATDDPPFVAPLASQPLVEIALQIASHLNIRNGRERAVARDAFRANLPDVIFYRESKGSSDVWIKDTVHSNRAFLKECLLDGQLVHERILDRQKLEAVLSGEVTKSPVAVTEVFIQLYIEAWLRRWNEIDARAAA